MRYWVKLWTEMLDDPKMGRLTDRQHRLCTNLFCLAGIVDNEGRLLSTADIGYKVRRSDLADLEADLQALAAVNILECGEGGIWQLVHFGNRNERPPSAQPEAVKERVARYRETKRECNDDVTTLPKNVTSPCNDPVTSVTPLEQDQIRSEADQEKIRSEAEAEQTPTKSQNLPAAALHALLALPDMDEATARKLTSDHPEPFCLAWAQYAASQDKLLNPAGYCVKGIRSGREPPAPRPPGGNGKRRRSVDGKYAAYVNTDRRRFVEGEYADIIEH